MSKKAISVEHLGKRYRIGQREPYKTFRDVITNITLAPLRILMNGSNSNNGDEYFWALKDVSFEVEPGEVVGIIGRNGAGKSTLLKILSRIAAPTEGSVKLYGRVGSLLEVGTGFHPELTGRENIYLSGSLLGMGKQEIDDKFEEIVKFSELEKFLDTPVKRYSSGMYVRLAFAVAAHLEPEILLVDEVLAVGDAVFSRKCIGKMKEISNKGRTILFVSHNLGAIGRLCNKGILLDHGNISLIGDADEVIAEYTKMGEDLKSEIIFSRDDKKIIQLRAIKLLDHLGKASTNLNRKFSFSINIEYEVHKPISGAHIGFRLNGYDGMVICYSYDVDSHPEGVIDRQIGVYRSIIEFPGNLLNSGLYHLRIEARTSRMGGEIYDYLEDLPFNILDYGSFASIGAGGGQRPGILVLPLNWRTELIGSI